MRAQVLLLLTCLTLFKSSLSQAPYDFDPYCRTFFRFKSEHVFPEDWKILLDSHDYQSLIVGTGGVWASADSDGDGIGWTQRGGICQYDLRACSYKEPQQQNNWVFTQFVSYEEAQEVILDITFRFSQCTSSSKCTNDFANVYRYDVTGIQTPTNETDPANYRGNKVGVLQQVGKTDVSIEWKFNRPSDPNINGFYLGFEDVGTCGQIRRILAHHKLSRGFRDEANLVTCPDTALPPSGTAQLSTTTCTCDANAVAASELKRSCDVNGVCTGTPACACKPGFELGSNGKCTACPPGMFKASVSNTEKCTACPLNSASLFEASEVCPCDCNTVRPANQPGADCSRPPSSPVVAFNNPPIVAENKLNIFWHPAADDGGNPDTLHYNVYKYDVSQKEYVKANEVDIKAEASSSLVSFTLVDVDSSLGVVVTSATAATGDEETIIDLSQVQNRFIQLYVSVKQLADTCTGGESTTETATEAATKATTKAATEAPTKATTKAATEAATKATTKAATEAATVASTKSETTSVEQKTEPVPIIVLPTESIVEEILKPVEIVDEIKPETEAPPAPTLFFMLGSQILTNGSTVSLKDIGEGNDAALLCKTDKPSCCREDREGEFYYPDGTLVPVRAAGQSIYRNRGDGFIRFNYRNNIGTEDIPQGQYRCEVPDSNNQKQKLFITIMDQ